jgi:FkbM family methyltransferase
MLISYSQCRNIISAVHDLTPSRILHIGAHKGEEASDYFENGVEHVTWFEANPELMPELTQHVSQFPLDQQIINCLLWEENKEVLFNVSNNSQCSSVYEMETHRDHYPAISIIKSYKIQAYRYDSLVESKVLKLPGYHFINIDTQGSELSVLRGFGEQLKRKDILGIYLEVNRAPLYRGIPMVDELDKYLCSFGFVRILTSWMREGWGDGLYLKKHE